MIADVLQSPCKNAQLIPLQGNLELIREAVLCLVNRVRAQGGETPLKQDGQLEQAAQGHSEEMVSDDYFGHVTPRGLTPAARIGSSGYIHGPGVGFVIGENLAWGTFTLATPQAIVGAWVASPEHLANIVENEYSDTGIGVVAEAPAAPADGAPGATYTQDFGVILR
jgi:uncharacterized protein YkwD